MPNKAKQLKLSELTILILKDNNRIFDKNKEFEIDIDTNSVTINKSRPSLYYHSLRVEAFGMCFDCILYIIIIVRCGCIILRNLLTTVGTIEVYKTYIIVD